MAFHQPRDLELAVDFARHRRDAVGGGHAPQRGAKTKVECGACWHSHDFTSPGGGKRVSKVTAPPFDVHGPCFIPGGRQAYMPLVKVWLSGMSWISPSRMNTSSQTSCVNVPFTVVADFGSNFNSRVTHPDS